MLRWIVGVILAGLVLATAALAQDAAPLPQLGPRAAPTHPVQVGALPVMNTTPAFDADAATRAYLARVSGPARAKSDAYFEGGYWLQLVDFVWGLVIAGLLLGLRLSVGLRDWVADRTRAMARPWSMPALYIDHRHPADPAPDHL